MSDPIYLTSPDGKKELVATIADRRVYPRPPRPLPEGASLFKYLTKREFAAAWIEGGTVPVNPASYYRSELREGVFTPDEVRQTQMFGVRPDQLATMQGYFGAGAGTVVMHNCTINGEAIGFGISNIIDEDSYIECYSLSHLRMTRRRMGKESCVRIIDPKALKAVLDEQIGSVSTAGCITYTTGNNRSHFEKSMADRWQDEFRFSWPGVCTGPKFVTLPPGMATPITPYP
ncbi:hypothetical protein [Sphingomonas sp.]|uniref:hypothetical protein n=1 Tax=Sphingomonas sp. TaxID=28214 RepID=UPI000DB628BE|nr:hypothetical protein [Sphingomonas sp.]PZU10046.1 MAG: hypothetical protein DI605_05445 [Sphingomonas sp.]